MVKLTVPTKDLRPGMELGEPVLNRLGQIIMSKGSTISPSHITTLKKWAILSVVVEKGKTETGDSFLDDDVHQQALARIKRRLSWDPRNPLEEEIISLAVQQVVHRTRQGIS
jgi:hypothetical protein